MEDVKKDIDSLFSKVNSMAERLVAVETYEPVLKDLLERNIISNEKLSETMAEMQLTMEKMNSKIDKVTAESSKIRADFEEARKKTNEQISILQSTAKAIEEKGKFDIWSFIKKYFPWVIVAIALAVTFASQYIKI